MDWLYVLAPFFLYGVIVMGLFAAGFRSGEGNWLRTFLGSISDGLHQLTGRPGWSMAGVLSCLWALCVAVVGLYWDVAFHIDFGRDEVLFTPSHTMIVIGLGGIVYSGAIATLFATLDRAPVGMRLLRLRVPYSALAMVALGTGSLAGFPLDELWHQAYGVDVTLWSPTHLQLITGAVLATIAVWLMIREGEAGADSAGVTLLGRLIEVVSLGAVLIGLSVYQGEFDFGVPQFQALYLPVLLAGAAGFTLVLARAALGPWGAVQTVIAFVVLRGLFTLLIAGALNHSLPRFPLYVASALVVEAVAWWLGTEDRLRFALVAGLGVATLGVAGELAWVSLSGWAEVRGDDLPRMLLVVPLAAVGAAVLGAATSRPVRSARPVRRRPAALAGMALAVALVIPLPRNVGDVAAVVRTVPGEDGRAQVEIELQPPDAADRATGFVALAWQGGGRVTSRLREAGPGRYVTSTPVPVAGGWKTVVALQRGDEVMAVPVYLPADPEIGASEVPVQTERTAAFVGLTDLLLRERHAGPGWPALVAYGGLLGMIGGWVALLCFAARRCPRVGSAPPHGDGMRPVPGMPGGREGEGRRQWREEMARLRLAATPAAAGGEESRP
ncbi:MAG: hypothetical protein KY439_10885 [Actinobacteria bacterium]|nr:hypothetical protein [Actinomycetota bacterium]